LMTNAIIGPEFNIIVEVQDQIGCMYKQRWCKVSNVARIVRLEHTLWHDYLADYVMVPDIFTYTQDYFAKPITYITCPRTFYSRCVNFGLKTMELRAETIHQFATSIITRIDIKDTVINDSFEIDPLMLDRVVYSFVFLCIIERNSRVDKFNDFIHEFKRTKNREITGRWWFPLDGMFKRFSHDISEWWCLRKANHKLKSQIEWYSALRSLQIVECGPIRCNSAINVGNIITFPTISSAPPPCIAPTTNNSGVGENTYDLRDLFDETPTEDVTVATSDICNLHVIMASIGGHFHKIEENDQIQSYQRILTTEKYPHFNTMRSNTRAVVHRVEQTISSEPISVPKIVDIPIIESHIDKSPSVQTFDAASSIKFERHVGVPPRWTPEYPEGLAPRECDTELAADDRKFKLMNITAPSRNHNHKSRAAAKLAEILKDCAISNINNFMDIGAGPGHASTVYPSAGAYHAVEYEIPVAPQYRPRYSSIFTQDVRTLKNLPYVTDGNNLIYCDIGPQQAFIDCAEYVIRLCRTNEQIIIKCFWPSREYNTYGVLNTIITLLDQIRIIKPRSSGEINREFYLYGRRFDAAVSRTDALNFYGVLARFEDDRRCATQAAVAGILVSQRVKIGQEILKFYTTTLVIDEKECLRFEGVFTSEAPDGVCIRRCKYENRNVPVNICSGVPGCGKTTDIICQYMSRKNVAIIVPTKRLHRQYKDAGVNHVYTFHKAFTMRINPGATIIIDEAFTFYVPYILRVANVLQPGSIMLYGDPLQIGPIDFTSDKSYAGIQRLCDIRPKIVNWVNRRNPHDVITLLRALGYKDMVGTSNIAASIYYVDAKTDDYPSLQKRYGVGPLFVYNQTTAAQLNVNTIHQIQGESSRTVYFAVDERAVHTGLTESIEHVRVMLSRHSEKLVFIGQNDHLRRYIDYIGSNIDINLQRYGMHLHDAIIPRDILNMNAGTRPTKIPTKQVDKSATFQQCTLEQAIDIMERTFKTNDFFTGIAGITDTNIPHDGGGRLIIKAEELMDKMRKMSAHGFRITDQKYAKVQHSDALTLIGSLSGRYAKDTMRSTEQLTITDVATMLDAFVDKFATPTNRQNNVSIPDQDPFTNGVVSLIKPTTITFLCALRKQALTPGLFEYHLTEAFRSVDQKCMPRDEYDKLLESTKDFWVSFFPKKQVKAKMQTKSYDFVKVSQGVSAYNKQVNLLYAAFGRMITHLLPGLLKDNVVMMCNLTDCEFSEKVGNLLCAFRDEHPNLILDRKAGDFSEYDSTQGMMAYMLMSVIYICVGMPLDLVYRYRDHSDRWTMFASFCKLIGELKFHSGTFETWLRNTFYNMCNIAIMYKWDHLAVATFTGDDSALIGASITFDFASKWLSDHGLQLKNEEPPVIEFAGKFILSQAVVPDALRRVAKYLSKDYKDYHQYRETIISLRGGLEMIQQQSDLDEACLAANQYYNATGLFDYVPTSAEMQMLYGFLHQEADHPRTFDQMIHFHKDILPVAQTATKN